MCSRFWIRTYSRFTEGWANWRKPCIKCAPELGAAVNCEIFIPICLSTRYIYNDISSLIVRKHIFLLRFPFESLLEHGLEYEQGVWFIWADKKFIRCAHENCMTNVCHFLCKSRGRLPIYINSSNSTDSSRQQRPAGCTSQLNRKLFCIFFSADWQERHSTWVIWFVSIFVVAFSFFFKQTANLIPV